MAKKRGNPKRETEYLLIAAQNNSRGVMVIVVVNGHGDTSSNPRRD